MNKSESKSTGDVAEVTLVRTLHEPGPYDRLWQPFIERWDEGHFLVAYGAHYTGKIDIGDILCCLTYDGGKTWGEPVPIFDQQSFGGPHRVAYANPVLYRPPGQAIVWCFAMRCRFFYRDSEDSELVAAYTADGGLTWQPVELMVDYHLPLITCAGITRVECDGKPRYLLPLHRNTRRHHPTGDREHFVLESTSLLEWRLAGIIPMPENGPVFLHEGNIAIGSDEEELVIVMRTARYHGTGALQPPMAHSSVSNDGGRSWSPAVAEPSLHNTCSKAYFGRDGDGRYLYVYSDGPQGERKALNYCVREPRREWSEPRLFFNGNTRNSYPTLLEDKPGHFLCVWDSSTDSERKRTAIRFGRLTLV